MDHTIDWGLGEKVFALTTSCPEVLGRAREVFSAWIRHQPGERLCHWTVTRVSSGWEVRQNQDEQVERIAVLDDVIVWLEYGAVLLLEFPDHLKVHGALLRAPGQSRAVLVLGHGGAGKSTLATALFGRGWTVLSDDMVFIHGPTRRARPAPRRIALRDESRPLLGEDLWRRVLETPSSYVTQRGPLFHAHELTAQPPPQEVTLGAMVILKNEPPARRFRPVEAVDAVFALAAYCGLFRSAGLGVALAPLSELAGGLPLFELTRGPLNAMEESLLSLGTALA